MSKIMLCGEIVWDIIEGKEYIGGAPFNVAVHLSRLGSEVCFVSRVGNDRLGGAAIEKAKELGIDVSYIQCDEVNQTGVAYCTLQSDGSAVYTFPDSISYDNIEFPGNLADKYDTFYFGTLVQMQEKTKNTIKKILDTYTFKNVVLDVNIRRGFYPRDVIEYSFSKATVVKMNDEESVILSKLLYGNFESDEAFAKRISGDYNIDTVLITKGGDGYGILSEGQYRECPVEPADVCDTIGAGDAFAGGFIHYFTETGDAHLACRMGGYIGTYVASNKSAVPEYSDELIKKLGTGD